MVIVNNRPVILLAKNTFWFFNLGMVFLMSVAISLANFSSGSQPLAWINLVIAGLIFQRIYIRFKMHVHLYDQCFEEAVGHIDDFLNNPPQSLKDMRLIEACKNNRREYLRILYFTACEAYKENYDMFMAELRKHLWYRLLEKLSLVSIVFISLGMILTRLGIIP